MSHEVNIICCPDGLLWVGKQPPLPRHPGKFLKEALAQVLRAEFFGSMLHLSWGWTDRCRGYRSTSKSHGAQIDEWGCILLLAWLPDVHGQPLRLGLGFQLWGNPKESLIWRPTAMRKVEPRVQNHRGRQKRGTEILAVVKVRFIQCYQWRNENSREDTPKIHPGK